MNEPFYYLRAGDRVPRDAVHVVVGGSVTVVPPRAFEGYQNLETVELQEGVEEIGARAFYGCPNLARVDWTSSLRTIGEEAFGWCERLSGVVLREGLEEIGEGAFCGCGLRRITVPSSVAEIGKCAFYVCLRLSEVILREGLRRIGTWAFGSCGTDFERIAVPSSVAEIGISAFSHCQRLSEVTLAGGTVFVASNAFYCSRLARIAIPSAAIVVRVGEDGRGRAEAVTGGIEWHPANGSPRLILGSPHLASMRSEDLTNLTDAIDRSADAARGAGRLDLADGDVSGRIRDSFADHLSTWYRWYKREVAAILELSLWKIELGRAREASRSRAAGGGKRARTDVPTRDDCRRTCGAVPIVGLVLSSLAGPHRRADRSENEGSIRP